MSEDQDKDDGAAESSHEAGNDESSDQPRGDWSWLSDEELAAREEHSLLTPEQAELFAEAEILLETGRTLSDIEKLFRDNNIAEQMREEDKAKEKSQEPANDHSTNSPRPLDEEETE